VRIVDAVTGDPLSASAVLNELNTVNSSTAADKDGVVEFANVMPGYLLLQIDCPDHESILERVHIDPGVLTDLGTYRLLQGACIEGRVVDESGKPVQGSIATIEFEESQWETRDWFRYTMQPNGEFRLPRMRHARFWMWADGGSYEAPQVSPPVLVDARGGDVRGLEFHLSTTVRVFVRLKSTAPWNSLVRLVSSAGAPQAVGSLRDEGTMRDITWLNALPGEYELQLVSEGRVVRSRHVTIGTSKAEVDL
jgi:hypothetical protein